MASPSAAASLPSTPRRRLAPLLVGSGVDAFGSTLVLTLAAIEVVALGGLAGAAILANAQMLGYGLGAVATGPLTRRWWLRRVLGWSLGTSLAARLAVVACLAAAAPLPVTIAVIALFEATKAVSITATQAEVVARRPGGVALSWSAASLSIGMGLGGALAGVAWELPVGWLAVAAGVPLAALVGTVSRRAAERAERLAHLQVVRRAARPLLLGAMVTVLAFGPIVLNVGLTTEVAGPRWVAASLLVLHASGLLAPVVSSRLLARHRGGPPPALLPVVAAAVWGGWTLAPLGPVLLLLAQLVSGLALHVYGALHAELLVRSNDLEDAAIILGIRALAWQLSAALASAFVPLVVAEVGVTMAGLGHVGLLALLAAMIASRARLRRLLVARASA